jgi:protein-S-isoprenylcysteine O-methyltransferase Ste14
MILLLPTGFFSVFLAQAANQRVQMGVDATYRGRVMALYVLVFLGTTPLGASLAGWWGEHLSVPSSIWMGGLVSFAAGVAGLIWQLRVNGHRLRLEVHPRPRLRLVANAPAVDVGDAAVSPRVLSDGSTQSHEEPVRAAA